MNAFFIRNRWGAPENFKQNEAIEFLTKDIMDVIVNADLELLNNPEAIIKLLVESGNYLIDEHPNVREDFTGLYALGTITKKIKDTVLYHVTETRKNLKICEHCNDIMNEADATGIRGSYYCSRCVETLFTKCSICGNYHLNDDTYWVDDEPMCYQCVLDTGHRFCGRCGRIEMEDEMDYCEECDEYFCENCECRCVQRPDRFIHDYGYKPRPIFHGKGKRFYGIELEIDKFYDRKAFSKKFANDIPKSTAYLKRDGSLSEVGVEVVSHPYTFNAIKNDFPFQEIIDMARAEGGLSDHTNTCGFHIHVSSNSFANLELSSTRILFVFERFWNELVKLSRRKDFGYCQKGKKPELSPEYVNNVVRIKERDGRYQAVNFCNEKTIEFRLWKGTLNIETLMATIELTDLICAIADSVSLIQLQKLSWKDVKAMAKDMGYKTLLKYCKRRNV